MSRPMFHETGYGRKFFERQLPELIKSINRVADALEGEEKKEEKRVEDKKVFTCLNCGETTNSPNLYKDTMGDFIVCGNCGDSMIEKLNEYNKEVKESIMRTENRVQEIYDMSNKQLDKLVDEIEKTFDKANDRIESSYNRIESSCNSIMAKLDKRNKWVKTLAIVYGIGLAIIFICGIMIKI